MENCEEQRRILNLPEYVFPAVMLVFGWPTKQQLERTKPQRAVTRNISCMKTPTAVWMETNFGRCSDISVRTEALKTG